MARLIRALLTTLGVIAYIGLAVAGEGSFARFASQPALLVLAVVTILLSAAALFTEGNLSTGVQEDRGNRWVLIPFGFIGLLLGYIPALTDRLNVLTIDHDAVRWIGVVLFAAGGALRIAPVFTLGARFSGLVAIQQGHTLVTTGLYRFIRNPSYLGLLISSAGWALAFRAGVGLLLTAGLIPPLIARMHAEEVLLGQQFGKEYEAYRARTWRLVPGLY